MSEYPEGSRIEGNCIILKNGEKYSLGFYHRMTEEIPVSKQCLCCSQYKDLSKFSEKFKDCKGDGQCEQCYGDRKHSLKCECTYKCDGCNKKIKINEIGGKSCKDRFQCHECWNARKHSMQCDCK